jgi:tape measure domain-containing protein
MPTIGSMIVNLLLNAAGFNRQLAAASTAIARFSGQTAAQLRNVQTSMAATGRGLRAFAGASTFIFAARAIANYSDAWQLASNKIAAANTLSQIQARSMESLNDIANNTRTSIAETAELYARLQRSTVGVAKSEVELARATELVTKAFKAGGASVQESVNGIRQLSQAISSGIFQGDELRSVRENAPLVAKAIADEFNTTIGGLKALGAEGKLVSDRVFTAILKGAKDIDPAFEATKSTISEAFTVLNNGITEYVAHLAEASGAQKSFTESLIHLGKNFEDIANEALEVDAWSKLFKEVGGIADILTQEFNDMTKETSALVGVDLSGWIEKFSNKWTEAWQKAQKFRLIDFLAKSAAALRKELQRELGLLPTSMMSSKMQDVGSKIGMGQFGAPVPVRPTLKEPVGATKDLMEWRQEVQLSIRDMARLEAATRQGEEAFAQMSDRIKAENELLKIKSFRNQTEFKELVELAVQQGILERARARNAEALKKEVDLMREISQQRELQGSLTLTGDKYRMLKIHLDSLTQARSEMEGATEEEIRQYATLLEVLALQEDKTRLMAEQSDLFANVLNSTVSSAISSVASAFADAVVEGENFRDMLNSLLKDLARLAVNAVFQVFLQQILGSMGTTQAGGTGLLGALRIGGSGMAQGGGMLVPGGTFGDTIRPQAMGSTITFHRGGIVGEGGIPRFHNGLMPGEMPAILKKGEGVFTKDQMGALGGKTVNNFTVINQAPNTKVSEERRENSTGGMDVVAIIRQTMTKEVSDPASSVHKSMKSTFGLSQAGVRR